MDIKRLVIAKPSGNTTAIVFDETAPEAMHEVGAAIQSEFPSVEQVLFVQKNGNFIHGQMAGGEFCGNAARSLGYVLSEGKEATQTFTMSGISTPVTVETSPNKSKLIIQSKMEIEKRDLGGIPISIVHLEGISHALIHTNHPLSKFLKEYAQRPDRWHTITHVLDDLGLLNQKASGLIFVDLEQKPAQIVPYVYVRDIDTLYPETACASGSIAVAAETNRSLRLLQPSGELLEVSLRRGVHSIDATVNGRMDIVCDGPVADLKPADGASRHGFSGSPAYLTAAH